MYTHDKFIPQKQLDGIKKRALIVRKMTPAMHEIAQQYMRKNPLQDQTQEKVSEQWIEGLFQVIFDSAPTVCVYEEIINAIAFEAPRERNTLTDHERQKVSDVAENLVAGKYYVQ